MAVFISCSQFMSTNGIEIIVWLMRNESFEWCILKSLHLLHRLKINYSLDDFSFYFSKFSLRNSPFRFSNIVWLVSACSWLMITGRSGPWASISPALTIIWTTSSVLLSPVVVIWCRFSNKSLFPKFFIIINVNIIAWYVSSWLSSFLELSSAALSFKHH